MRVSLEEFLGRYPRYEIDESALVRVHSGNVRGYSNMAVNLSERERVREAHDHGRWAGSGVGGIRPGSERGSSRPARSAESEKL
jgi:hypothetical protein